MTILKQEVRTISTIGLKSLDLGEVIKAYKERELLQVLGPRAFSFMDIDDMTMGNLRDNLKNLQFRANSDTFKVIAFYYGFDGWENAGHFSEASDRYSMTVYAYGDNLN